MKAVYTLDKRQINSGAYTKDEITVLIQAHFRNGYLTTDELADLLALIAIVYPDPEPIDPEEGEEGEGEEGGEPDPENP